LQTEISLQGLTKDIKVQIASNIHSYLICALQISIDLRFKEEIEARLCAKEIVQFIASILEINNKEILHAFIKNGCYKIFEYIHDFKALINPNLLTQIDSMIKEPVFTKVENMIITSWRYHLSFYEDFLSRYLLNIANKDEATMVVFPLMLKGASD
jgi:hypothetical protein